jgi:hypothetical protein
MPSKPDHATALAEKLLQTLEAQRAVGASAYPLTLLRLAELSDPQAPPELVFKAAGKKPFADTALVAQKKNLAAPVALRGDTAVLAASPLLLAFALETLCKPEKPTVPVDKLAGKLLPDLRQPFIDAVNRHIQENTLPSAVGAVTVKNAAHLYLQRMPPPPPKKKPEVALAEKLLQTLEAQRSLGGDAYPLPLQRLVELTDPQAPPKVLTKATATAPFAERALVAQKKAAAAPVALREDLDRLAASPLLLEFVLEAVCTPQKPTWPVAKLQAKVDPSLRQPFADAIARQMQDNTLPASVATVTVKNVPHLYLRRLPPPPPKKKPEVALAEKLVATLEAQRTHGAGSYPLTLARLIELTDATAAPKLIKQALGKDLFQNQAVLALKGHAESPVALAADAGQLAASPLLLELLLKSARTEENHAQPAADLKKKLSPALQPPFEDAVRRGELPSSVGRILHKGKALLFLTADLHAPPPPPAPAAEPPTTNGQPAVMPPPLDFAHAFDEAFDRLDRGNGAHNFVSLVKLRAEMPVNQATFDTELRRLRSAGRYTLSAAEGRHGLRPEEQEAGITEDGTLLLYVSRKTP